MGLPLLPSDTQALRINRLPDNLSNNCRIQNPRANRAPDLNASRMWMTKSVAETTAYEHNIGLDPA